MKLSSKARYGLKAMCYLACDKGEAPVSLGVMAGDLTLSEKYLEQLMTRLKKSGLVTAVRGAGGGYRLGREAADISVGEIIRALEDGLCIVDCLTGPCANRKGCATFDVWNKLNRAINDCLDGMSLASVTEKE